MKTHSEKIPDPKELEKEIGDFLTKKFGNNVKVVSPMVLPQEVEMGNDKKPAEPQKSMNFDLKPEELIAYLDQYVVKQDEAKAVLATKICTHFNRVKHTHAGENQIDSMVGSIKNNILMIGPTGVGKTYIIKLIASKIGVPFAKGDATKFSETGYVGGDVEDLVRDLVREANDDIEQAEYGIIYIDEIDKIASSHNLVGADVSRTGVQRALLKPMEETEVDLKVPHDPISMMQEIEHFRKSGKRDKRSVNTKNILFIMSGAFTGLTPIIQKRLFSQKIGFGARISGSKEKDDFLKFIKSEDLIAFGFESEFVGRLPVRSVFEHLAEDDLYWILRNPNNPIILGKKLDFAAYGIDVKFDDDFLRIIAANAFIENTGARGLVSAVEKALLEFEKKLPSTKIKQFPVTADVVENPETFISELVSVSHRSKIKALYDQLVQNEKTRIQDYLAANSKNLAQKYNLTMTTARTDLIANCYTAGIMDTGNAIQKIKSYYDEIKKVELNFFKNHDINIVLEEDAIDFIIQKQLQTKINIDDVFQKLNSDFEHGLKLVREKTNRNRFFISRDALLDPESYIGDLIKAAQ